MPKDSLMGLLELFPYFLDKNSGSNFFKSQDVTNREFQDLYQSLFDVSESFNLSKNCLIWKSQDSAYDYCINFVASYPHLKSVTCFKNNEVIYSEEYNYSDDVGSFTYIYEGSSENVIPSDTFEILVETFDEYSIRKGFPENDTVMGDIYDHDSSLDRYGRLNNIPRKEYVGVDEVYYPFTEPAYNDRLSEDDYHYLQRILYYNLHLWDTPRPVLELWKRFGVTATMENREKYLIRMIDMDKHPEAIVYDDDGVAVDFDSKKWTPRVWQHRGNDGFSSDLMCGAVQDEVFFFVDCSNQQPLLNQKIVFSFSFLNQFAESVSGDYFIVPYLNSEPATESPVSGNQWIISSNDLDPNEINSFFFEVYGDSECETLLFTSDEILVQIRGCNTGDWYVDSENGDDDNNGSIEAPFETIGKAVSSVYANRNLIVLLSEEYNLTTPVVINQDSQIVSCNDSVINTTNATGTFFLINPNIILGLKGIELSCDGVSRYSEDNTFVNHNSNNKSLRISVSQHSTKLNTSLSLSASSSSVVVGETVTLSGVLTDEDDTPLSGKTVVVDGVNVTTGADGSFTRTITCSTAGNITFLARFMGDEDYAGSSSSVIVTVNKISSSVTLSTSSASVETGESFTLSGSLTAGGSGLSGATLKLYDGATLVDSNVTTGSGGAFTKTITASSIGEHSYTVVYDGDSTHTNVTSTAVSVAVTKKSTALTFATDKASVDVGEQFTLSGTLTSGVTVLDGIVKLYDGNSLVDSLSVDDGDFSKSITFDNTGLGTHTYHVEFDGDEEYDGSVSSNVSVVCGVTPVPTTVSLTSDKSTVTTGGTVTFTATVLDQNDDPVSGETVTFKRGPTVLGTDTTDASGEATYQETISLSPGSYSFSAYASNGVYGMIIITVVAPVPVPDSVSLVGSKSILSYADGESCVLTATVLDSNDNPLEDVTVTFKKGTVTLGTDTTDASGEATYTYSSAGSGDISFTAEVGSLASETYGITDALWAHLTEETVTRSSSTTLTQEVVNGLQLTLPNKFEFSFKLKSTLNGYRTYLTPTQYKSANDPNYALFVQQTSSIYNVGYRTTSTNPLIQNQSVSGSDYHTWKIVRDGNSFTYYIDNTQVATTSNPTWFDTYTPHTIVFNCWAVGSVSMKDIVIKPL